MWEINKFSIFLVNLAALADIEGLHEVDIHEVGIEEVDIE